MPPDCFERRGHFGSTPTPPTQEPSAPTGVCGDASFLRGPMPLSSHRQAVAHATSGSGNRVLAAMTRAERALLAQMMEPVDLALGATLFTPGEPIRHLVFLEIGQIGRASCRERV